MGDTSPAAGEVVLLTVGAEFPAPGFLNPPRSNPTGFEADVANEIARRLGIPKVKWLEAARPEVA